MKNNFQNRCVGIVLLRLGGVCLKMTFLACYHYESTMHSFSSDKFSKWFFKFVL